MANYNKATNFTAKDTLPTGNAGKIIKGTEIDNEFSAIASAITSKSDSNSPTFTGTPIAPTAAVITNNTQIATTAFVKAAITDTIDNLVLDDITHEGTANDFETVLNFVDPTADRTITFPDKSGTVAMNADIPVATQLLTSTGTYSIAGTTTLTVTITAHGRAVADVVYLNFTSGTAADGYFTIATVPDANSFTVTYGSSITTSGNVTGHYSNNGAIPVASNDETIAGSSSNRAVSPAGLVNYIDNRFTSSGSAPNFLARMWVYFNGSVDTDINGTWTRSGTLVTVTMTNHKFVTGNRGYLNFSATVTDGVYETTRVDDNTFTVVSATSGTASGTVISQRQSILGYGNVSVVSRNATGDYIINFEKPMPTEFYGFSFVSSAAQTRIDVANLPTTTGFRIQCTDSAGTATDATYVSALVIG